MFDGGLLEEGGDRICELKLYMGERIEVTIEREGGMNTERSH